MNRFDIINKIGDKYHILEIPNQESLAILRH